MNSPSSGWAKITSALANPTSRSVPDGWDGDGERSGSIRLARPGGARALRPVEERSAARAHRGSRGPGRHGRVEQRPRLRKTELGPVVRRQGLERDALGLEPPKQRTHTSVRLAERDA